MRRKFDPNVKYGHLKPIARVADVVPRNTKWVCECDCGNTVEVLSCNLLGGKTKSCGCRRFPSRKGKYTKHGRARTAEYKIWNGIKQRCLNPNQTGYEHYGGRGITVCDRWASPDGFAAFFEDMGPRPSPELTVERRDNNGPYSPENCYWGTESEQGRNKRNNRLITFNGETLCMAAWAERNGLSLGALKQRLRAGWDVGRALTTPVRAVPKTKD